MVTTSVKACGQPTIDWRSFTEQVKRAVLVSKVLRHLGAKPHGRKRFDCPFCAGSGSRRDTVSVIQDRGWRCHRCGEHGDVIALVMKLHGCDFMTALRFLAGEAGVELPGSRRLSPEERQRFAAEQAKRERVGNAAEKLEAAERGIRLQYCELIHKCERRRREVGRRLRELQQGAPENRPGECEACWGWLAALASLLRDYIAAYWVLAFGSARLRATFTLRPAMRQQMITLVVLAGGVAGDDAKFVEMCW